MPRRGLVSIVLTVCLLAAAILKPTTGAARTGQAPPPVGFKLRSSHGYTLGVYGLLDREGLGHVFVRAEGRNSSSTYIVPGQVGEGEIEAEVTGLLKVDVTWHGTTGGSGATSLGCVGGVSSQMGFYEGTIEFEGEEGFTSVDASRAKGDESFLLEALCPSEAKTGRGPGLPGADLSVRSHRRGEGLGLTVVKNDADAPTQLEVNLSETIGDLHVERTVRTDAPSGAFEFAPDLGQATVKAPAPFFGSGTYHRSGARSRWRGDLKVDLPGHAEVALTGPDLQTRLFRARFKGTGPLEEA